MIENSIIHSLKSSKLFQGLSDSDIREICGLVAVADREFSKNQVIVNQGEPVSRIGILKRGTVISSKYHFNGNVQILRIYNRGEAFSLDAANTNLLTSPVTLTSQTDCAVVFVPYAKLVDSDVIRPEIKKTIMSNCSEILSNELIRLMYKIDVLSNRTLRERILTYLSLISERVGSDSFDIGMNQEQFAQYLCVNRSVLSNELNQMRKAELIDYKGKRYKILKTF
ncbi:MAG TPA: Crp/Fnr family transcriptional regulator [Bacillota bacterium]|nr:Crp/Fnr family transcriptional regulator [Bacillota bacterium]